MKLTLFVLATLSSAALPAQKELAPVQAGIDVLAANGCRELHGRKIGLLTNHTGLTLAGRRTIDVLAQCKDLQLVCLFSPEHGLAGALDQTGIADATDPATGLHVFSLYGETRKPTAAMLAGLDTLVFDIQDVGCRFYTYVSTMALALEAAGEHHLRFVVLDRPNPLGGVLLEGPPADKEKLDFVGCYTLPLRHGMTAGELARMFVGERGLQVELQVIQCVGWERETTFAGTGRPWVNPSPNLRSVTEAMLYPGIGLLEGTNVSVGRGTDTPFEVLGAPWCNGQQLAARLQLEHLPGIAFVPIAFTPTASKFQGERCAGINIVITDWSTFRPVSTGLHIACALRDLFPKAWEPAKLDWLLKNAKAFAAFEQGLPAADIEATWRKELDVFRMRRKLFLLYP